MLKASCINIQRIFNMMCFCHAPYKLTACLLEMFYPLNLNIRTTSVNAHVNVTALVPDAAIHCRHRCGHVFVTRAMCVSRGDSMLDYNHTSLTWHIMTLSSTAPPLSVVGHKLLSNEPQECRGLRHEEMLTEVTNMEDQGEGDKVFLCAKIHLFPCLTLSHTLLPLSPLLPGPVFSFLVPSCPREESPSQNMCKRIKLGCTSVVALTDRTQDPCFNLYCYTVPCAFQHFSCLWCWLLWQWRTRETSGVNLIKLSGNASLVWWLYICEGKRRFLCISFLKGTIWDINVNQSVTPMRTYYHKLCILVIYCEWFIVLALGTDWFFSLLNLTREFKQKEDILWF